MATIQPQHIAIPREQTRFFLVMAVAMALVIAPEARMLGSAPMGAFLVIAAAVSWGLGTVLFKRFDLSLTSVELTAWQLVFGGIPIAVCALILDPLPDVSTLSTRTIMAVLYTAFIAQLLGQWAWFRGLQLLPANVAAIGSLSIPIVGLYASAVLLEESITWIELMALAMVLYVLISQAGLVVGNRIAAGAADSGPAIYNYTWLILQLPFGIIGVTVLTVVMPRLSRNAAAENGPAVLADLSLTTRLTMVTLIPIVAMMTVGGPAIGSALFSYGNFGAADAGYLGVAISLSAFTLIPYTLLLLQLRDEAGNEPMHMAAIAGV